VNGKGAAAVATRISVTYSGDRVGEWPTLEVDIAYRRRTWTTDDGKKAWLGGWRVVNTANDRELGWVAGDAESGWSAHITSDAFRGDGTTGDKGEILDDVPHHLYHYGNGGCQPIIVDCTTREEAAEELVYHLAKHRAPALGFGRHYLVRPYNSTVR
jgi:hypothetical protein